MAQNPKGPVDGTRRALLACLCASWLGLGLGSAHADPCADLDYAGAAYTICTADTAKDEISLFWRDPSGKPYATLGRLAASLTQTHRQLLFGMNAGMFQEDLSPVGLYIEAGAQRHAVNTRNGFGNFHLKPNGIFFFGPDGAGVMETRAFIAAKRHPAFATQSGPMLVVDGAIHPKIQPDGTSLKIRNGVGARDGHRLVFAISRDAVSFHAFATLFRDRLGCANALFLDGSISTLYAPALGRTSQFLPVGPMVGVTAPAR